MKMNQGIFEEASIYDTEHPTVKVIGNRVYTVYSKSGGLMIGTCPRSISDAMKERAAKKQQPKSV